ncbi:hypothetical protein PS15m_012234 [Mucor circinelloides]
MPESVQDEYLVSTECFDLQQFLSKRLTFTVCGYEHLPPSAVKSLRFKKYSALPTDDFLLLLQYYTSIYSNAQYILGIGKEATSMDQDLVNEGYLKAENKVIKFVSLSLFYSKYKSCESNAKNHRGSHVLAYSISKRCLAPAQIQYFFRHLTPVFNANYEEQQVNHTFNLLW